ncbi:MAG: hypothetical protein JWM98_2051 [Thermoleophilia bacterium]|nr:hypothetical protein [Thermoleophilia bacterium]
MQLTSAPAPALAAKMKFDDVFTALDATATKPVDATTLHVQFHMGSDEAAFSKFVRDEVDGAKLVLDSDMYTRCMPAAWDADRAVKYLSKGLPGVTGVVFAQPQSSKPNGGSLFVTVADDAAASHLRAVLRDQVDLGLGVPTRISIAPTQGAPVA